MKLFRIFAVGLILSAVIVATAVAPVSNAAVVLQPPSSFSSNFFNLPSIDLANFNNTILMNYTPAVATTTGPTSNPPEADVVPNFSGLVVEGPTAIDSDDDGTNDLLIDDDGEVFVNNYFAVNANPSDGNNEIELIGTDSMKIGDTSNGGVGITIDNAWTQQVMIDAYDTTAGTGFFTVWSPNVRFAQGVGDVDMEIEGNLEVDGLIKSADAIGSYYINRNYESATSATVSCNTGDNLTGCAGYASTGFKGSIPSGLTCTAYRATTGGVTALATCFDPAGITSGTNYL